MTTEFVVDEVCWCLCLEDSCSTKASLACCKFNPSGSWWTWKLAAFFHSTRNHRTRLIKWLWAGPLRPEYSLGCVICAAGLRAPLAYRLWQTQIWPFQFSSQHLVSLTTDVSIGHDCTLITRKYFATQGRKYISFCSKSCWYVILFPNHTLT